MATVRLEPGTVLGERYEIVEIVGRGGMGTVYRALDRRLDTVVAVKELTEQEGATDDRAARVRQFEREARLLGQLAHPNLPKVTDYFVHGDHCYLVMEFVVGETLEARLREAGGRPLPLADVARWGMQLADVLVYLHGQQPAIVFRDIKPANIMVGVDGNIRLIDFGIARRFQADATKDTLLYGSPGYSPPEQYGRSQTDPRSDIYALAATLHHLATGRDPAPHPFKFPPARTLNPAIPVELDKLLADCLQIDVEKRKRSAADIRETLAQVRSAAGGGSSRPIGPRPIPAAQPNGSRRLGIVIAGVAIVVVALGSVAVMLNRRESRGGTGTAQQRPAPKPAPVANQAPAADGQGTGLGALRIASDQAGAAVTVDGKDAGRTPCEVAQLAPGKHLITVAMGDAAPWSETVEVHPGETVAVTAHTPAQGGAQPAQTAGPQVSVLGVGVQPVAASGPQSPAGLKINVSLRIAAAGGKSGQAGAFFYDSDRTTPLRPRSETSGYKNADGQLSTATSLQIQTDPAELNPVLFLPESELPVPANRITWRLVVYVDEKPVYLSDVVPLNSGR